MMLGPNRPPGRKSSPGSTPDFSIVIPAHNAAATIGGAIDSALAGPGPAPQVIVVDDGSTDGTAEAAGRAAQLLERPVVCIRQPRQGVGPARNRGLEAATGRWVVFLDADDALRPDALAIWRRLFERMPAAAFAFGARVEHRPGGRSRVVAPPALSGHPERDFHRQILRRRPPIQIGSMAVARAALECLRFAGLKTGQDFVLTAQLIARHPGARTAEIVMDHHADPRRQAAREATFRDDLERSIDALFDPAVLPAPLMALRRRYAAATYLTIFRALHRLGDDRQARRYWRRALAAAPAEALRWIYARKLLRGLAGLSHPMAATAAVEGSAGPAGTDPALR